MATLTAPREDAPVLLGYVKGAERLEWDSPRQPLQPPRRPAPRRKRGALPIQPVDHESLPAKWITTDRLIKVRAAARPDVKRGAPITVTWAALLGPFRRESSQGWQFATTSGSPMSSTGIRSRGEHATHDSGLFHEPIEAGGGLIEQHRRGV